MKNTKHIPYCILIYSFIVVFSGCASYPDSVKSNFQLAGNNKNEFNKVIRHYFVYCADSLKRKVPNFLIGYMDALMSYVSKSRDSFQVKPDTLYRKENQPSESIKGFNVSYDKYSNGLQDKSYILNLQTVSAQFLMSNINQAFRAWKSPYSNYLNFAGFCENILPYRVASEPLSEWRVEINKQFIPDSYVRHIELKYRFLARDIWNTLNIITPVRLYRVWKSDNNYYSFFNQGLCMIKQV